MNEADRSKTMVLGFFSAHSVYERQWLGLGSITPDGLLSFQILDRHTRVAPNVVKFASYIVAYQFSFKLAVTGTVIQNTFQEGNLFFDSTQAINPGTRREPLWPHRNLL
jgi:hypothetical protein